jgi:hypothetical protein
MNYRKMLFITAIATTVFVKAANYEVKGQISDASTTETLPGATFAIYSEVDTVKPIVSGLTDDKGAFLTDIPQKGIYKIKFSFLGMDELWRVFKISDKTTSIDLGNVALSPNSEVLEEIVVTGKRPIIEANGEKVVYNIDEDPAAQTNTVLEMLRKVPLVTVDGQDNIRVNGQQNFKIYINGKPDPMMEGNASTILKNLPASSIKKIEVITEPGAKYDAEGVGGILNIVTIGKSAPEGYLATVDLSLTQERLGGGVYARTKVNKVTASMNIRYMNGEIIPLPHNSFYSERETTDNIQTQDSKLTQKNNFVFGNLQMSWEPDTLNLITVGANIIRVNGKQKSVTNTQEYISNNELNWSNTQHLKTDFIWGEFSANVNYQHNFRTPEHNIVASYQYAHGTETSNIWQQYENFYNYSLEYPYIKQETSNPTNEHTLQLDYTLPIKSFSTLEIGAKSVFRRNYGNGYNYQGDSFDNMIPTNSDDINMDQYQDVVAVYGSYSAHWKSWSAKAGVRYEYTHMGVKFHTGDYNNYSSNLNDIVPNGAISYNITPMQSLRLSYQMRIRRPSISELNPYAQEIMPGYVQLGNPDLTSEKTHNTTLTYSNFGGAVGGNIQASYMTSSNDIGSTYYVKDNIYYTSYGNVGHNQTFSLSGYLSVRFNSKINLSLNGSVSYERYSFAQQNLYNHGWSDYIGANFSYTMPWKIEMNAYGGASSRNIDLQSWNSGWRYYGLAFSRKFLKDERLKISVSGMNIFTVSKKYRNHSWGDNFDYKCKINVKNWSVGLSVSYTLGSMKADVKQTSNVISNDDVEKNQKGN